MKGAADSPVCRAQLDDLGVVEDEGVSLGRGADVREAEPTVVRPGVRVEAAPLQRVDTEAGHAFRRALGPDDSAEPLAGECRVEPETGLDRQAAVGTVPVKR